MYWNSRYLQNKHPSCIDLAVFWQSKNMVIVEDKVSKYGGSDMVRHDFLIHKSSICCLTRAVLYPGCRGRSCRRGMSQASESFSTVFCRWIAGTVHVFFFPALYDISCMFLIMLCNLCIFLIAQVVFFSNYISLILIICCR